MLQTGSSNPRLDISNKTKCEQIFLRWLPLSSLEVKNTYESIKNCHDKVSQKNLSFGVEVPHYISGVYVCGGKEK